jgi:hypothetical protein
MHGVTMPNDSLRMLVITQMIDTPAAWPTGLRDKKNTFDRTAPNVGLMDKGDTNT